MTEFYTLRGLDADGTKMEIAAASTYGEIKMWFLTKFPEIEKMNDTVSEIIKMAREARKTQKKTA
jgi:predicted NBD/HSP70 family sugar kinase